MSHGGRRAAPDDFGRAVSKVSVAQICETAGFHGVKVSALEAFADTAIRYLFELGKMAQFYANFAGRSQCNVFDLIKGLEDLESTGGLSRAAVASEATQCLAGSGTVTDIVSFMNSVEEVPFAHPIPRFPVTKDHRTIPSFMEIGETPPAKHVPAWLPAFPDPHTYIHTPIWNKRVTHPREDKVEMARQRRKAERSLLSLQQRLLCKGSVGMSSSIVNPGGVEKNPFLQVAMPLGNKDVSLIALPSKLSDEAVGANCVSVLEIFAPAIEALKNGLSEEGQEGKTVLPAVRPSVRFKFRIGKKLVGEPLDTRHQKEDTLQTPSLAAQEDGRDDKKRRAEYILKQSTENPQELTLL